MFIICLYSKYRKYIIWTSLNPKMHDETKFLVLILVVIINLAKQAYDFTKKY